MKKYVLNKKTGTLHIRGACAHTKGGLPYDSECFETESEAFAKAGKTCKFCKICLRFQEKAVHDAVK